MTTCLNALKTLGRMEEEENSLGKTLLCLERPPRVQPGLPAVSSALIMLIHKPSIILMSLFCGWPCFLFFRRQERDKKNLFTNLSGTLFSFQRKGVVEFASAEPFMTHVFPRAGKPGSRG